MLRTAVRLLAPVLLFAGVLTGPAKGATTPAPSPTGSPAPGIGLRLLDGPADALNDPRAHRYIVDHLVPGATITRRIEVTNGDAEPTHVLFYPAAAAIRNGVFQAVEGHAANDLTTWMTMSPAEATLQPGESLPVTVTIAVPPDAGGGERYAAALVEVPAAPARTGGVNLVSRVGIRVYLSVSTGATPPSAFRIDTLTAGRDASGRPWVSMQVHNTGARALDLSGDLRLDHGPAGLSAGPFPATPGTTLAVGDHESVTVLLDPQLPAGPWDVVVRLVSGLLTESATGRLAFPTTTLSTAAPSPAVTVHGGAFPTVPVGAGAAVIVVAAPVTVARLRIRRRRKWAA